MQSLSTKYDALLEDQGSELTLAERYATLIDFKKSQAKINLLISLGTSEPEEEQELQDMKAKVEEALKTELAALKDFEKRTSAYALSLDLLRTEDVGKLAKIYLAEEKRWRNGVVAEVDVEEQQAKVRRCGPSQAELTLPAYYLKVLKDPPEEVFEVGVTCKAVYSGDGELYPCVIERVSEEGVHVKYKQYGTQEVVGRHLVRAMKREGEPEAPTFESLTELRIPEKLRVQPNDPENVKKSKKFKVKALKFAFKTAQIDEVHREKQQKWKEWSAQNSSSAGLFKTKHDLDALVKRSSE